MSENQELELGKTLHPKILKQYGGEYDNPAIREYVTALGNRLAEKSHRDHLIYHFTVLDTPQINAFALPGGYIYVTRGIMAYMNSEAELAGVIGHEIGHVTARHGVRQHTKGTLLAILAQAVAGAANNAYADDLVNLLGTAIITGYGRENELEADRLGAEYSARIGYNPRKMLDVLEVLKDQEEFEKQLAEEQNRKPNVYHGLFATHPKNDDRLKEVIEAAAEIGGQYPPENSEAFLTRLDGMAFGLSAKEGVLRGVDFYHADLGVTFRFPNKWVLRNRPDHVLGHNLADTSFIAFTVEDRNRKESPRRFLARKLRIKEADLQGERPASELDGYTAVAKIKTPYGVKEGRVSAAFFGKKAFLFRAASRTPEEFAQNDALFLETIASLRPLLDAERKLAEPFVISLVRAEPGDTFASLAAKSGFGAHAEEHIRLINAMYPDGEPRPGQLLKTVR